MYFTCLFLKARELCARTLLAFCLILSVCSLAWLLLFTNYFSCHWHWQCCIAYSYFSSYSDYTRPEIYTLKTDFCVMYKNVFIAWKSTESVCHLDQLVEVSVLPRSVFVLVQKVLHCLCAQQQLYLLLLVKQRRVVLLRKTANVWQPEGRRVGPFTQEVEGQRYIAHGL